MGPPNKGPTWVQLRDSIRRDLEVALQSLSFLERFGEGLDSQRRLFIDFPRITEELRTGAMERLASAMEHLYEGAQGASDLNRFLRDLPLALGHLAAAEFAAHRQKLQASAKAAQASGTGAPDAAAADGSGAGSSSEDSHDASGTDASGAHEDVQSDGQNEGAASGDETHAEAASQEGAGSADAPAESSGAATGAGESHSATGTADAGTASKSEPVSPRVELRTRLLAAAPQLNKAAQAYRRNTATVRRAAAPRRAVGPWRSDREVLEQARRAVEFANKIYDAYAEAWNDAPLTPDAGPEAAAEMDRFLAWTQLSRYAEVARTQSSPSSSSKAHEAAPGVKSERAQGLPPPATQDAHVAEAEAAAVEAPVVTTTAAP